MQLLKVLPNPFAAFDREGTPCAVCPRDPEADAGGPGHYVGARVDRKNTQVLQDFTKQHSARFGAAMGAKLAAHEIRSPMQVTRYEYLGIPSTDPELASKLAAKEPIEIPASNYYKERLREGVLLPANAETARVARLNGFIPIAEALLRASPNVIELPDILPTDGEPKEAPPTDTPPVEVASATVEA